MLKNDLLTPYLQKEEMDCDETGKDTAFNNHWERVYN